MDIFFDKYQIETKQTGPVHFDVTLTNPEGTRFFYKGLTVQPAALTHENIVRFFLESSRDKNQRKKWAIDLDVEIIKEVVKEAGLIETKSEKTEITIDCPVKIEDNKENKR